MDNNNFFAIGEIAKAVNITRKTILGYEAKGLITPDKKDGINGNRYYTIDTFTKIRTIRILQNLGLTLNEIHEYYSGATDLEPMIQRLEKLRDELNLTLERLKERTRGHGYVVKKITLEPQTIYRRVYDALSIADKTNLLRNTALEAMRNHGTDITKRMYYTEFSLKNPADISYCVIVPKNSEGEYIEKTREVKAISCFHHGSYETIEGTRKKLVAYATENNITLTGTFRSIYLEGPPQHKDKSKFITQIVALIK